MNKDEFWQIIEQCKEAADGDLTRTCKLIGSKLNQLEAEDILKFYVLFNTYYKLSYKNKLWAAAYVINGGCSDDGFDYFRAGLIALGKEVFLDALKDPDSLAQTEASDDELECEEMLSVAYKPYLAKVGLPENDSDAFFDAIESFELNEVEKKALLNEIDYALDIDVVWDEEDLQSIVPKLCEKMAW